MSPKTNIIILSIIGLVTLVVMGYSYYHYNQGIDWAIEGMVSNTMGLPHQQRLVKLESENIHLFYPELPFEFKAGEPVEVIGQARVFEGNVEAELVYADDEVIDKQFTTARAEEIGEFGSFTFTFNLPSKEEIKNQKINLKVFSTSAKDGSRENEVFFPVIIVD